MKNEKLINIIIHLLPVAAILSVSDYTFKTNSFFIAPAFIGIIPLVLLWKIFGKTEESKRHRAVVTNWLLTVTLVSIMLFPFLLIYIGMYPFLLLDILTIVFCIYGAIQAYKNNVWKYPLSIQFIDLV